MNIFNVLSKGKSRLHEPSISAMLAYLLSPNEDHGLSDTFLKAFLHLINNTLDNNIFLEILDESIIYADVELEVQYNYKKRCDIDIQISILDKTRSKEIHRIIIENKIKTHSANPKQLLDYYKAVINDEDFKLEKPDLSIVFLTPKSNNNALISEFNNLKKEISINHNYLWIYWLNDTVESSILHIIKDILKKELYSEINPINEYMRHTLKAFVQYVKSVVSPQDERRKMRTSQDIGDIVEEMEITTTDNKRHRIVRRDSTQIQVFDCETDEKEVARHVMSQYIDENNLNIDHPKLNTRMIG
jgi:hypothetical protein